MATKVISVRTEYERDLLRGVAEFSTKQISNLMFDGAPRLRAGYTYVFPRQWAHAVQLKEAINGVDRSNKWFALAYKDGRLEYTLEISVNALKAKHFGSVAELPDLLISAVPSRTGGWRPISGANQTDVVEGGVLPYKDFTKSGKHYLYLTKEFAVEVTNRDQVWVTKFENKGGKIGWSCAIKTIDGAEYLDLGRQSLNTYKIVNVPKDYSLFPEMGESFHDIVAMQQDLPE